MDFMLESNNEVKGEKWAIRSGTVSKPRYTGIT
jgi:hypothetical protein